MITFLRLLSLTILNFIVVTSCSKEKNVTQNYIIEKNVSIKDTINNVIINPIPFLALENENDSIKKIYKTFNNYEIWYIDENRKDLLTEIKNCYKEGLQPEDYQYKKLQLLEEKRKTLSVKELVSYDVLLTKNFENLANHLHSGKIKPQQLYTDWDLPEKQISLTQLLPNAIKEKKIATFFKSIKPNYFIYNRLKLALQILNEMPNKDFKNLPTDIKIQYKDTTNVILEIKKRLAYWKDYKNTDSIATTVYDSITLKAVKKFQKRHGLQPDGVIGKGTLTALNFSKKERIEQVVVNLERWRWFAADFGSNFIVVNIPNYSLDYAINKDTIDNQRVVVGTTKRKTPILSSKLSNIVFNPTWTIPPTIVKEDLTPSATRNRGYFASRKITIYDGSGNVVSPYAWKPSKAKSYRYVQKPGYNNSLGLVKFNFPNNHLVYLHDTNHRDYFSRTYRSLSSGCVRVENPLGLSKKILTNDDSEIWNGALQDSIIKNEKTKIVKINQDNYIYLLYFTAWVENNTLQFREDIYKYDKDLFKLLTQ